MTLHNFIKKFSNNNLVRLLYRKENLSDCYIIADTWDDVSMDWEITKHKGIFKDYGNHKVISLQSIMVDGPYSEALNIVIEK